MDKSIIEKILNEQIFEWSELGSGMCNTVYKALTEKNCYCIKVAMVDSNVKESNTIFVEAQITKELQSRNPLLPIPQIVYIDPEGAFYIYHFVDATPLGEGDNEKYTRTLLPAMGEFHHNINCVDKNIACNVIGIREYTIDDFFNKYGYDLEKHISNTKLPEDYRSVLQTAFTVFEKTKNNNENEQLLHNDIHGENIFLDSSGKLDCVIDFGDAVWGDVHLDMMWYVHGYPHDWLKVVEAYEKASGLKISLQKLIALACIRFTRGLCEWYLEGQEIEHCNEKFNDYKNLMNEFVILR